VVQHLEVLEQSGLVRTEKTGRVHLPHRDGRRALWERRLDRLGALLDEES